MATLCLVNELDFSSLEVLSVAVRNRLEEFDDWSTKTKSCAFFSFFSFWFHPAYRPQVFFFVLFVPSETITFTDCCEIASPEWHRCTELTVFLPPFRCANRKVAFINVDWLQYLGFKLKLTLIFFIFFFVSPMTKLRRLFLNIQYSLTWFQPWNQLQIDQTNQ